MSETYQRLRGRRPQGQTYAYAVTIDGDAAYRLPEGEALIRGLPADRLLYGSVVAASEAAARAAIEMERIKVAQRYYAPHSGLVESMR